MHAAAYKNLPKVVKFLAAKGARIDVWNRHDKFGWTPLAIAAGYRFGNFKPSPDTEAARARSDDRRRRHAAEDGHRQDAADLLTHMTRRLLFAAFALGLTIAAAPSPLVAEDAALARARALLDSVPLIDGHNDLPWTLRETFGSDLSRVDLRKRGATVDTDIPRLREGRVSGQFWSVFIPSGLPNPARTQLEQIELARRMIDAYPDTFLFATRAADVERARGRARSPRSSAWRTARRSRTASARCAPTTRSASAT